MEAKDGTSMMKLVFATNNNHKYREIKDIISNHIVLLNLSEIGCFDDIPEEQDTLEGNAAQKAFYIYNKYSLDCFADDTGLEIDALHGEPGVYSARYAGEKCTFEDNVNLVLKKMTCMTNRKARFKTVIALVVKGKLTTFNGIIEGNITFTKRGTGGFGYDPIFEPQGFDLTFAEMSPGQKNLISHRALAVEAFEKYINTGL